jgi:hypothetical protein
VPPEMLYVRVLPTSSTVLHLFFFFQRCVGTFGILSTTNVFKDAQGPLEHAVLQIFSKMHRDFWNTPYYKFFQICIGTF